MNSDHSALTRGQKAKQFALHETRQFVIMALYLWVLFGLFVLNETVILRVQHIRFMMQGFAVINALVLAKVMMVAEGLNFGRWLDRRPLIYPILTESFLLAAVFLCFHVVESVAVGFFTGKTFAESLPTVGGGGLSGAICVALILFLGLIPYFSFKHFVRVLGWDKVRSLLFATIDTTRGNGD
jgi:hypothetical protein